MEVARVTATVYMDFLFSSLFCFVIDLDKDLIKLVLLIRTWLVLRLKTIASTRQYVNKNRIYVLVLK